MTSDEENPIHTFVENGTYTISLTVVSQTCNSIVTITQDIDVIVTKVQNLELGFDFSIFPNPNDGLFYLKIESEREQDFEINIIDVNGKNIDRFFLKFSLVCVR